jgi:N-acetylmuramoyl-L-alanine amidase
MKKKLFIINFLIVGIILIGLLVLFFWWKQLPKHTNVGQIKLVDTALINDGKIHIVIDAGHGGPDPGAGNLTYKIFEKNITRMVADAIMAQVDTAKYTVIETRPGDKNIHRHTRIGIANDFKTSLLISIHSNAFSNGSISGFEVGYSDSCLALPDSSSKLNPNKKIDAGIADTISKNIAIAFPKMKNRGIRVRKDRIWMIYAGLFPSILIEWGYITNKQDLMIMKDTTAHKVLARAVWQSIDQHFGFAK